MGHVRYVYSYQKYFFNPITRMISTSEHSNIYCVPEINLFDRSMV